MDYSPLIEQALRVAAQAHRRQLRKATDIPYFTHPAAVALILLQNGFLDDVILATALLHDVVEDTDFSLAQLQAAFPAPIPEYVAALTERKRASDGSMRPWLERKQESIKHLGNAPLAVRAVALADKLHNLSAMLCDLKAGASVWDRFNAPRAQLLWYYRAVAEIAGTSDSRLVRLANQCRQCVCALESP
ncbi:MAG TPA: HD domain-containing protein [Planctomycetaceae bacterium]|jgi:(p)ppGpp synthase/HD superfamily hydrolase|nr:HD domain-containing protein [Planctomycetaceae bacterium]